jgi:hypothetical protein
VSADPGAQVQLQGAPSSATAAAPATQPAARTRTLAEHAIRIAALFALAALVPIFAGFESIIFLVILGFTLFEAWRQNRRFDPAVTGPYRIGQNRDGQSSAAVAGG